MNPELLKKMLDCSQGEIPEFLESIRNLEEQQQSSIKQPSMIESATLERASKGLKSFWTGSS